MSQLRTTITTINPVIGDESFVAAFGRLPTTFDDPRTRVATHVGYAARTLRERDVSQLSQPQRARRMRVLDALDRYVAAGAFPDSETDRDLMPTFLDPHSNVRCAVAHLVETTAGTALMLELDRDHHNDYIADLAGDPRFLAWTETSGLTHEELAIIQPSYPPPPPTSALYTIAAEGDLSVHDDSPTTTARSTSPTALHDFAMLDGTLRVVSQDLNHYIGRPSAELDGKLGITNGEHTAYDLHAKLGGEVRMHEQVFAYDVGIGLDSYGPATPRAWTIPIDGSYHWDTSRTEYGIHAGPRFTVEGDRKFGWNVGLDLHVRRPISHHDRFAPRELGLSLDANRIGDSVFLGLSLSVGNPRGRYWYED